MKFWVDKGAWYRKKTFTRLAAIQPGDVRQILVIKHAAFGDLLLTRPFFITLREYFPEAHITLSIISHYVRGAPEDLVDEIHTVPGAGQKAGLQQLLKKYRETGKQDLLFDLTASTRSLSQSLVTPARFKIGYQHRGIHRFIFDVAIPRSVYRYEAETFLEQLQPLGLQYCWPLQFNMEVTAIKRARPYIIYFPSASSRQKSWLPELFSELISTMAKQFSAFEHIVLSGIADWEKQVAKEIVAPLSSIANVTLLDAGKDDAAIIKGASILVGNDTGIRHLATVLGTPTVGIFFNTPPFRYWPRFGQHQVVYNIDGSLPNSQQVASSIRKILDSTIEQAVSKANRA